MNAICITPTNHIKDFNNNISKLFNEVVYSPEITKKDLIDTLKKQNINSIFVNPNKLLFKLDSELLKNTSIEYILTASTGTNHIDKEYCNNNNIKVFSLSKEFDIIEKISSTAEHAFALMMSLIRNVPSSFDSVKNGNWDYEPFIGRQLNNLTIGIIGYGRLGKKFYNYCKAFDSNVIVYDPFKETPNKVDLDYLLSKSDIISLHIHLDNNYNFFNNKLINKLNHSGIYLINTSRGEVVDENAIIDAIKNNKIKGYATDVLADELGNISNSRLVEFSKNNKKVIITPHIGGMTSEAQEIAYNGILNVFRSYLDGIRK
jgi:D-3-phosphoglycerate dehydrogenase